MAKIAVAKFIVSSIVVLSALMTSLPSAFADQERRDKKQMRDKIEYYQTDNITNQIPYFDNRFRIDAEIEEIILIFYRKSGTQPVILVQPDGSKIRVNNYDKETVEWYDDRTYDMIKIARPMVGPWQAIGQVLPHSKILVVTEVNIVVEPLPEIMLSGETIKITGKLMNGDAPLTDPEFRDVVNLDVDFYSTNDTDYDNFGAAPVKLTTFRDDGQGLDEYENDSVFTGEFEFDFAPGKWLPHYIVKMPMLTRELKQAPIIIQANPISINLVLSDEEATEHQVTFNIDERYVDVDSLLFQGKTTYPDRQEIPFSVMSGRGNTRTFGIEYTEPGIHRMKVNAFGKTKEGREFRLTVPEYTFNVERKELLVPELDSETNAVAIVTAAEREAAFQQKLEQEKELQRIKDEAQQQTTLIIILVTNFVIILCGIAFYFVRRKRMAK